MQDQLTSSWIGIRRNLQHTVKLHAGIIKCNYDFNSDTYNWNNSIFIVEI